MHGDKFTVLYKTTNLRSEKFYIGVHSTSKIDFGSSSSKDRYLGSNVELLNDIKRIGRENFVIEILVRFENKIDAYHAERELVNEEFILKHGTNIYNKHIGGTAPPIGSFRGMSHTFKTKAKWSKIRKNHPSPNRNKKASPQTIEKLSISHKGQKAWNLGIPHINATKDKISSAHKNSKLKPPSRKGCFWVTNGNDNLFLSNGQIIPIGFKLGRYTKWNQ